MAYDYAYLMNEIKYFTKTFSIGLSSELRDIPCIEIGYGEKCAVFCAAFHGLEYLTTPALIYFAKAFLSYAEYHSRVKAYIVPMINPDGVEIAINGINPRLPYHRDIIKDIGIIEFKKMWQANAAGVDINHNFDADWDSVKSAPSFSKYGGLYPESEPETRALVNLLKKTEPELFIAFHSQGKEIYYDFNGMESKLAKTNAEEVAKICGYKAASPSGTATFGGAKDWYIKEFHKQAYTIELGCGKNPLPQSQLPDMSEDTLRICMELIDRVF